MAGKPPNRLETETLSISTNEVIAQYLDQLVETGFYGKNPNEAAERLVVDTIQEMLKAGKFAEILTLRTKVQPAGGSNEDKTKE